MAQIQIIILIYPSPYEWFGIWEREREREKRTLDISNMNLSNNACKAPLVESSVYQYHKKTMGPIIHPGQCGARLSASVFSSSRFKVQGSRFFIIRHIHNHTSIISSEMQVELKKITAFTWGKGGEKNYPQTMLLGEYSVRTGKTPQQHKSTYTT